MPQEAGCIRGSEGDSRHGWQGTGAGSAITHRLKSTSSSKWDDVTRTASMLAWLEGSLAAWGAWGASAAGWDMVLAAAVFGDAAAVGLPDDGRERCRDEKNAALRSDEAGSAANAVLWIARRSREQLLSMQNERELRYTKT